MCKFPRKLKGKIRRIKNIVHILVSESSYGTIESCVEEDKLHDTLCT